MSISIQTLKSELEGVLHGTTINKIQNVNGVFNRAARQLLLDIDPQETKRVVTLAQPISNNVYDYAIPTDLKGNKIIDLRPQVNRNLLDRYNQTYSQDFSLTKNWTTQPNFNIAFSSGIKFIRIVNNLLNTGILLDKVASITDNGTWSVSIDASNLRNDYIQFVQDPSSLQFDISGLTGVAKLTNSTLGSVDLTTHLNQAIEYYYVYLPNASAFTSVQFKWGTDASNYWTSTSITTNIGNAFTDGWNLLAADWLASTKIGSPDVTNVKYIEITFNYTGLPQGGVKVNSIYSQLGTVLECEYYSKFLFRDSVSGAFQETVTDDSNLINLDTESYNIYFALVCLYAVQQSLGEDSSYDTTIFTSQYRQGIDRYKAMYKSEITKPKSTYYSKPRTSWKRFLGRGYNQ